MLPKNLGMAIRSLREQKGGSQEERGWRVQTTGANISRIENDRHRPGAEVMQDLAREFGLKVHELYALAFDARFECDGRPAH